MDCSVCCERITKRTTVTCHFCDFVTCKSCASRYILESTINPACMNCKKPWTREVLANNFSKVFLTREYKAKRERDLFETEKALLPETQPLATAKKDLDKVNKEIYELQKKLKELKRQKYYLQSSLSNTATLNAKVAHLTIKCPAEGCRGFVNSVSMICEVCDVHVCKDCHEVVDESIASGKEHECNPDTVESVKLLKRDTKNCPSCKTAIHKIDGCDQMYCTQCHTAFSWRTGEIVHGRIHNPHYYEYLRRTGGDGAAARREVGDIPCGGVPTEWEMRAFRKDPIVMGALRNLIHIEQIEFGNYRTDNVANNRDLRIKYLTNEITEDQFKKTLQKREKETEKKREILQVLNTCVVAGAETLRTLMHDIDDDKFEKSFATLREFTNESMKKIAKLYNGCKVPFFVEFPEEHNKGVYYIGRV